MANCSFCLTVVFLFLSGGFPLGVDATTTYLTASISTQYFTSRNYPFNYDHNTNDRWVIDSGPLLYRIRINVVDTAIETNNRLCSFDYFQFIDGNGSLSDPISAKYCGSWSNCYFETSGRYATIFFTTDSSGAFRGFKMSYNRVSGTRSSAVTTCTGSGYRSGAPPSVSVPVAWRVGCTICLLCGLVGWGGYNMW